MKAFTLNFFLKKLLLHVIISYKIKRKGANQMTKVELKMSRIEEVKKLRTLKKQLKELKKELEISQDEDKYWHDIQVKEEQIEETKNIIFFIDNQLLIEKELIEKGIY